MSVSKELRLERIYAMLKDSAVNDQDKSFEVPSDSYYIFKHLLVTYECDATVGNRVLLMSVTDNDNVLKVRMPLSGNMAASETWYINGMPNTGWILNNSVYHYLAGLPEIVLHPHDVIRFWDVNTVGSGDDMTVFLQLRRL